MSVLHAFILGIVEGFTEFLPISSTFHLLFAGKLLGTPENSFTEFFAVFVQGAAMIPVILLFWREWFQNPKLLQKVAVAFVPTAIVGFVLHKVIKEVLFQSNSAMLVAFVLVALVFFFVEWLVSSGKLKLHKALTTMTYGEATMIGLWQAAAVLPGVSRAGAVIVALMLMGYRRDEAAKFSFMLAVPTILAAAGYDFLKMRGELAGMPPDSWSALAVGCVAAFLSSLVIVRWFIGYLRGHSLASFGWYRILAATILLLLVGL